jgi:hypothetical protein
VIPFDLAVSTWVIGPAEDQFDTVFLCFSFEDFRDELFPVIDMNRIVRDFQRLAGIVIISGKIWWNILLPES